MSEIAEFLDGFEVPLPNIVLFHYIFKDTLVGDQQ
jgi:hypothetical protein